MARPFVYVNMAMTADGKITSADREYPRFTSPHDRLQMDRLRADADAILLGAGTLRADDPTWHVRDDGLRRRRRQAGKPAGLWRVLVSSSLDVDPQSRFFDETDVSGRIIATTEDAAEDRVAALTDRAEVWRVGRGRVDLPALLERLGERGIKRLLVEGGGELNWALAAADLVDELNVTVAPALLGGRDAPTLLEGDGFSMAMHKRLRLDDVRREGDELFCRWSVVR